MQSPVEKETQNISDFQSSVTEVYTGGQTTEADSGPAGMRGRDAFIKIERQRLERGFSWYRKHHKIFQERAKLYGLF